MHDGMQYDPIQGRGQGHEPFTVGNMAIFKTHLFRDQKVMGQPTWVFALL